MPETVLQRKASCACGGDCPRCENQQQKKKKKPRLQTKLKISTPGDQYELEADRVAEQVMRMTDSQGAEKIAAPSLYGLHLQRKCPACESMKGNVSKFQEEEETLQPKEGTGQFDASQFSAGTQAQVTELRGGGQPLAASVREFFEPRFNQDFSRVRIHTDERAAASARAVNALAYTVGHDVAFDAGQYAPETTEGRRLLAHELTHVVQQGGSRNQVQRTYRLNELLSPRGAPEVRQRTPDIRIQRQSGAGARPAAQPQGGSGPTPQQPGVRQPAPRPTQTPGNPPSAIRCDQTWEAITVPSTCINFANQRALRERKRAWRDMIRAMYARSPEAAACVRGWFIGTVLPPPAVIQEVSLHRDCMLAEMGRDPAVTMRPLALGANLDSYVIGGRRRPVPGYRDFADQAEIWWRKFSFEDDHDPFDRITQEALDACPALVRMGVRVNQQWTPRRGRNPTPLSEAHRTCWLSLSPEVRQRQILQASSAPGISRHHFGTDMDFFSAEGRNWEQQPGHPPPQYADEYTWMHRNAARFGFIQPYIQDSSLRNINNLGYMAEQWHWSYYPIAQALIDFFQVQPDGNRTHRDELDQALFDAHRRFRAAAMAEQPTLGDPLSFLAPRWDAYVGNVAQQGSFPDRAAAPRR